MRPRPARRLRRLGAHLAGEGRLVPPRPLSRPAPCAAQPPAEPLPLYADPQAERLPYTDSTPEAICAALRTDGCALLHRVLPPDTAAHLAELLRRYEPLPHEDGTSPDRRVQGAMCRPRSTEGKPPGFVPDCDWTGNLTTLFQRDPDWLALVGPSPIDAVMEQLLGEQCHLITMKGWRNPPGHNAAKGAAPGVHGGNFHNDELGFLPRGVTAEVAEQFPELMSDTFHIIGTLCCALPADACSLFSSI